MSIFPYIYYVITSFDITTNDDKIAMYAGMVTSAFAFAEFSAGVVWGRLSDRIGRKPVLIGGLAGTALSMILFGFARSLPMALVARALGGLLNGNIGVLQTTVAELVSVKEHQPRAYSVMPFVWCLGSIIGPALGGALAQPRESFPDVFPKDSPFDRYPFLLPNLACTIILVCGVAIGILFLKETHEDLKHRRDWGLELGELIVRHLTGKQPKPRVELPSDKAHGAYIEETVSLIEDDDPPPGYRTSEVSPSSSRSHSPASLGRSRQPRAAQKAFARPVIMIIVGYGILALYFTAPSPHARVPTADGTSHTISFDQLMPILLSSSVTREAPAPPFKFTGGFGLSSKTVGTLFSIQGVYSMAAQLLLFPFAVQRLGTLRLFRLVVITWPVLYLIVPYVVLLPPALHLPGVMLCLLWRITAQVLAFPANAILLANAAPSSRVLGLINGVAASTASFSRALGPTASGAIQSAGLRMGCTGLPWWIAGVVALLGGVESLLVSESKGRLDDVAGDDEDPAREDPAEDEEKSDSDGARSDRPFLDPASIHRALRAAHLPGPPSDASGPAAHSE